MKKCRCGRISTLSKDATRLRPAKDGNYDCDDCRLKRKRRAANSGPMKRDYSKRRAYYASLSKEQKKKIYDDAKIRRQKYAPKIKANAKKYYLQTKYGLSVEDHASLIASQGNRCAIFGSHQDILKKTLSVDHCHRSGKIRGALCTACNVGLGNFQDDLNMLLKAAEYLRSHPNE